ncbi:hypothetical protein FSP39_019074 [Pinctada imbricata]|uniref:Uncharacterized protein n=1 Tax=Pinctada imbricata TaxID=66713 RepID=A0AA88YJG6_PINIB|nr:hypothetical protein FSP39_019074 [Pinctada imbricata]
MSIFEPPPTDTAILVREWIEFRPVNQLGEDAAIEFHVVPQSSGYLDLKQSRLNVKIKITKGDGSAVTEADVVAPINLLLHSLFSQVECQMQQNPFPNGQFDDADAKTGGNLGLYERWSYTRNGGVVDLEGPILLDLFQQERLILNRVTLDLKLWPSRNAFRLMSDSIQPNEKMKIVDATLKMCMQRPNPAQTMAHSKELEESTALYPYAAHLRPSIEMT